MTGVTVGLDFETYSGVDLTVHGLDRYVSSPTFKPLIGGVTQEGVVSQAFDWVLGPMDTTDHLYNRIAGNTVVCHNAGFERAVLQWLGINHAPKEIVDSAVAARVAGANGHLFQASRQLGVTAKLEAGSALMKLFSIPGKYQEANGNLDFDPRVVHDHPPEWSEYKRYCRVDAEAGLQIWNRYGLTPDEASHAQVTYRMNDVGWPVDRDAVEEMYARYLENQAQALSDFIVKHNAGDFNIGSYPQKVKWCAERGIKAKSFDEKAVEKLHAAITKRLSTGQPNTLKDEGYRDVLELLELLQLLGGSSLKKLKVILDTINQDSEGVWRLKDQYIHAGAGQTLRTTGRSVQMQNLKRLKDRKDMAELFAEPQVPWSNTELAENIRQVFTSSHTDGELIVGDFSSIESRGLAYQAGAQWKLDAYRRGEDLYKLLAAKKYGISLDRVDPDQRQFGKVGELSCGYAAGGDAVKQFAEKMGTPLTEAEANQLVWDWRDLNPEVVAYWALLDEMIHAALQGPAPVTRTLVSGMQVIMWTEESPASLRAIYPKARSLMVQMTRLDGMVYLTRVFHGAHETGRNVRYFKASKSKTGDAWKNHYTDPKTKELRFYEIYGGKMSGILTQSFCRELFFDQLHKVETWTNGYGNVELIGQFHDEIVVDWWPEQGGPLLGQAKHSIKALMSGNEFFPDFPMAAEVKSSYRYIK